MTYVILQHGSILNEGSFILRKHKVVWGNVFTAGAESMYVEWVRDVVLDKKQIVEKEMSGISGD